ncbi:MAG TPA: response regulator [Chryseolinea sp.]|nr:response regulator [Chryseolinea sp.]
MLRYNAILLIDDDEEDQEIFMDALREVDPLLHCSVANDGEEALELLNGDALLKPDLIFIDMNMPKLTGKQVLQALKFSGTLRDVPVVMYSTFFGTKDIEEIKALGAAHHMLKATRFDELCTSLRIILSTSW